MRLLKFDPSCGKREVQVLQGFVLGFVLSFVMLQGCLGEL